ncbi:phage tail protein [Actinobacillus equuli subsp. haemolyticus]|uniref:phage tail protein n=1 Tax=Actinobacillus equuli TaxID=718 RepID=UPI0024187F64|nr:phage tail protein [Actinobacillus equuli]MDG4947395.1 phage tail protein [Actinobacillus equuli subsp. haemolyticus]MDG4947406.1 phage tail protein [Actinobacillus equuli subsp. haemolyticus]MDG4949257.1 phage tail protein [Actinobacillus equuli subsp. haemolyticus]
MYFMLGDIMLDAIHVTEFSENHSANFSEHEVLKGKPRLQAMGENLTDLRFAVRLHYKNGGVESRYQSLLNAKAKQAALALIWGRGKYKGNYVITDISASTQFTDGQGNVLCREMDISLREFVGETSDSWLGAALNIGSNSLLGSILPEGLTKTFSGIKETVNQGVALYQKGKRAVDEVQNTIAIIRQLKDDPQTALAYLPSALNSLSGAILPFGELTNMQDEFKQASVILQEIGEFSDGVAEIYDGLNTIKSGFNDVLNNNQTSWENWFTPSVSALSDVTDSLDVLAPKVAKMTAWIVLRTDYDTQTNSEVNNEQ